MSFVKIWFSPRRVFRATKRFLAADNTGLKGEMRGSPGLLRLPPAAPTPRVSACYPQGLGLLPSGSKPATLTLASLYPQGLRRVFVGAALL